MFTVGNSTNPPSRVVYNYANTDRVTFATRNIYISVGLASNTGGGNLPDDGISWEIGTIAIIVIVIIVLIIIIYFWYSYSSSTPQKHPAYRRPAYDYPNDGYPDYMQGAVT